MSEKEEQLYCVTATVRGTRIDVSGPMDKYHAEDMAKFYNSQDARRRDLKYPKVAKYPYKERKQEAI